LFGYRELQSDYVFQEFKKMKFIITPKEQWELIKPIWRILVATILIQLVGGLTGLIFGKYGHPFIDFWFGGAVLTFPGFIVGSLWYKSVSTESIKDNLFAFSFIGLICLSLTTFAFLIPLEEMSMRIQDAR